jgi:phosphatidylserine/phosphatidylglycerophosphate/cardiolipin synthase-like enzyme
MFNSCANPPARYLLSHRDIEALDEAQDRLIIICPWLSEYAIDTELREKFEALLKRKGRIAIGWGHLQDLTRGLTHRDVEPKGFYSALPKLKALGYTFPDQVELKPLGTHEKYFVCDEEFAVIGSHTVLTSGINRQDRGLGLRTDDFQIISDLIQRFESAPPFPLKMPFLNS